MNFRAWLKSGGFDFGKLGEHQCGTLRAMYDFHQARAQTRREQTKQARRHVRELFAAEGGPAHLELTGTTDIEILAAAASENQSDQAPKLPTFKGIAYGGGAMRLRGWVFPVVVDLQGLKIMAQPRPVLRQHDPNAIVGHTESIPADGKKLRVEGTISGVGEAAREIVETAKNKFPWRLSVGAMPLKMVFVEDGETAQANGQTFKGPVYVARKALLGEISFVPMAGDDNAIVKVAASADDPNGHRDRIEVSDMKWETWLTAQGFNADELNETQEKFLRAAFDAEVAADKPEPAEPAVPAKVEAAAIVPEPVKDEGVIREETLVAERDRVAKIIAACKDLGDSEKIVELQAQAMRGELAVDDLLTQVVGELRESRAKAPAIHVPAMPDGPEVIKAAVCMTLRLGDVEKVFDEKTLEAAEKQYGSELGLQEMILTAAFANDYHGRWAITPGNIQQVMRAAFPVQLQAAGFSTISLPNILSDTANMILLESFMSVEQSWQKIAATGPVKNFFAVTRCRLTGDLEYEELGPGGEIQHGTVGEETSTIQAKTYARMMAITRVDVINDDMGALKRIPQRLGRGGGLKLNTVFWTAFMDNAGFFKTTNKNYKAGLTTALDAAALEVAQQMFLDQVDKDKKPVSIDPRILLVPTAKLVTAEELMTSTKLYGKGTTDKDKVPADNIWAGKFETVTSRYLSNATIGGNSAKAWYLTAAPADVAVIRVVFLGGKAEPTIESAEADFNVLGIQYRAWHDFGVALEEHRAGVKMLGE